MSMIERKLEGRFLEIYNSNGQNPKWAVDTLYYEVFVAHNYAFEQLNQEEQWIVRNYMDGLTKIYG